MEYLIPRMLSAFLSGMIISQAGSFIQMGTRNILASPSTLGFDGLSIFWVLILHSVMLMFGWDYPASFLFFVGAPIFLGVGWFFARFIIGAQNIERLVLVGLTFNLLVGAVFSLWQFLFVAFNLPFPVELWFGHFRYAEWSSAVILSLVEIFILLGWWRLRPEFYLFSLGKNVAQNWQLKEKKLFSFLFMSVALGTYAIICLFGAFAFLGLVFPIIGRKLWFKKFDLKGEILVGGVMNGLMLMIIDSLCYFFSLYGAEVPVGLIATAVGALSLIFLLWTQDKPFEVLAKARK